MVIIFSELRNLRYLMKPTSKLFIFSAALCALTIYSCGSQKPSGNECATFMVGYNADVKPIIDANCATTCHSAASHAAGIDLSNYESVKAIATKSKFLGTVRHLAGFPAMPKKAAKLSDSSIQILSCWVQNGMKE